MEAGGCLCGGKEYLGEYMAEAEGKGDEEGGVSVWVAGGGRAVGEVWGVGGREDFCGVYDEWACCYAFGGREGEDLEGVGGLG